MLGGVAVVDNVWAEEEVVLLNCRACCCRVKLFPSPLGAGDEAAGRSFITDEEMPVSPLG